MTILMTSPDALLHAGQPNLILIQALRNAAAAGYPVVLVSNHAQSNWCSQVLAGSGVQYRHVYGRQRGTVVRTVAEQYGRQPYDVLVLATKSEDVQMGKNGGAVLLGAGWAPDPRVQDLGIKIQDVQRLLDVIQLTSAWSGSWWYSATGPAYTVFALADLSGYGVTATQADFASRVTNTVKSGGARLTALLAVTTRSLMISGVSSVPNLIWGVYPGSGSANDDRDTLCDFTHGLRTTVSRVQFSKRGCPLFIRHRHSIKRSRNPGGDRTDPSDQVLSMYINPEYRNSLTGKNVIVVDDCTTYGLSFGVAAALLRRAGAASVTGVALGKFGNRLQHYDIAIYADPFRAIPADGFVRNAVTTLVGTNNSQSQAALRALIA